jgi:hypothetical protein
MSSSSDLNEELIKDFTSGVQTSYATLLAALTEVTHPKAGAGALILAQQSITDLIDRWRAAQLLAMPAEVVRSRFPLTQLPTRSLIDGLLSLAMYSEPMSFGGWNSLQSQVNQLYQAIEADTYFSETPQTLQRAS